MDLAAPASAKSFRDIRAMGGRRKNRYSSPDVEANTSHLVWGYKDCGVSTFPTTFVAQKPKEQRAVFRSFDFTTERSIRDAFGNQWVEENNVFFDMVLRPDPNDGYMGLNLTTPESAIDVYAEVIAALEDERDAGDVGILVMDHYQTFFSKVCENVARAIKGADALDTNLKFQDWAPRTRAAEAVEELMRAVPVPGGHDFMTGPGPTEKPVQRTKVVNGKPVVRNGKEVTEIVREWKWPVWLGFDGEMSRDRTIVWSLSTSEATGDEGGRKAGEIARTQYLATIKATKSRKLPKGLTLDWTDVTDFRQLQPQIDDALRRLSEPAEAAES